MTQDSSQSRPGLDPAQQTFQAEIQPLVDSGQVSKADLDTATDALITLERTPEQRAAVRRVWTAYTGADASQLPEA
ncbi:MAG: hypothetical protein SWY16_04485 [Cyanobacteriota bacterium]|nr:hypothetical protein [Cyanobacteriota bacterium]